MKRQKITVPAIAFLLTALTFVSIAPGQGQASQSGALTSTARQSIEAVLDAYEQIRDLLAEDRIESLAEAAGRLERAAGRAARKAPISMRRDLEFLAENAKLLSETPTARMEEVRQAFGEISRPVVRLLSAEPSLTEGRHVFECPMATGYNKWVQLSSTLSNPYMGTRMPTCGAKTRWQE